MPWGCRGSRWDTFEVFGFSPWGSLEWTKKRQSPQECHFTDDAGKCSFQKMSNSLILDRYWDLSGVVTSGFFYSSIRFNCTCEPFFFRQADWYIPSTPDVWGVSRPPESVPFKLASAIFSVGTPKPAKFVVKMERKPAVAGCPQDTQQLVPCRDDRSLKF